MKACILKESSRGIERITPEDSLFSERKIFFEEEVTTASAMDLIRQLLCLESIDPEKVISIYINSPGGEVNAGLAAYDAIRGMKCPVKTVCIGLAASMGSILFLSGDERLILPRSKVMIHDPLINGITGRRRALELEREAAELMETREILAFIIAERCGKTLEEVYEKTKEDCWLSAGEALEFGLVTKIAEHV